MVLVVYFFYIVVAMFDLVHNYVENILPQMAANSI